MRIRYTGRHYLKSPCQTDRSVLTKSPCSVQTFWSKSRILSDQLWHSLPESKVAQLLGSDTELGLTPHEATRRQQRYGANEIEKKKATGDDFFSSLINLFNIFC
ncbi:cation-transporting P-type ATPase [Leptothermofonsia sp. ETS-13]|uniref:cation-transporting P-type ATPase n=1 Tax=Leptothermofonsia sp. ETS-13 TaxID=3035696 RepID=UPI003BA3B7D4